MEVTLNDMDKNGNPVEAEYYIEKAVRRAYRDASSHVLSIEKGKDDSKKNPHIKERTIERLVKELKGIHHNKDYKDWHNYVCKDVLLEEIYKEENVDYKAKDREFSYGISQKLVNMTIKYLTILYTVMADMGIENVNKNYIDYYEKNLKKYESDFDIPIDSYILEGTKKNFKDFDLFPHKKKFDSDSKTDTVLGIYSSSNNLPWSKWNEDDYKRFQDSLKEKIQENLKEGETILDWEGKIWIEIAKERKK